MMTLRIRSKLANRIRSELANTRDRVSKLEATTSDTRDTLQSTEYDNEQRDYESLNRKCNKVNNTVSKLHKRVLTIEESITGIRKAGSLLNTSVANNNANLTERLNTLELARASPMRSAAASNNDTQIGNMTPLTRGPVSSQKPGTTSKHPDRISHAIKHLRYSVDNANVDLSPTAPSVSAPAKRPMANPDHTSRIHRNTDKSTSRSSSDSDEDVSQVNNKLDNVKQSESGVPRECDRNTQNPPRPLQKLQGTGYPVGNTNRTR